MPIEDVRKHVLERVNAYRFGHRLPALALHEDESRACKAHAEHLAAESGRLGHLYTAPSADHLRPGWRENVVASPDAEFEAAVDRLVWRSLSKPEHARAVREAKTHFAADVAVDRVAGRVFLVMRFR
ncbi:MAG: CAP domain-containing protein [Candidatus Micrarchaeota archaeon]